MDKMFSKILDDDEKIIKTFKPNRTKFNLSVLTVSSLCLIWFVLIWVFAILFPEEGQVVEKIRVLIPIGLFVFTEIVIIIFANCYFNTLHYAYTNKRLIIRSGIFGIDYRSLDMGMIGAIDVYVSLIDKIVGKDTGAICFGSTASPMIPTKGGSYYRFSHIVNPYETCKEIKAAIDLYKKTLHGISNQNFINAQTQEVQSNQPEETKNEVKTEEFSEEN